MVAEWLVSGDGHKNSATKHPLMADGLMMPELAPGARMRNGPEVVTAPLETK